MAFDAFIKFSEIEGESTGTKHEGWIEMLNYDLDMAHTVWRTTRGSRGTTAERVDFSQFGFTNMIPPKKKYRGPEPEPAPEPKSKSSAIPLNSEVTYAIGKDTPPVIHVQSHVDYTVKAEMSGTIDIKIASPDRYRHSIELLMSRNTAEIRQKLYDAYDPAIRALTAKPELVFESGKIKIDAPIAAHADAGPFVIEVQAVNPTTMAGIIRPNPISGRIKVCGKEYKYLARIEMRGELVWHNRPKGESAEPIKIPVHQVKPGLDDGSGWVNTGKETANIVVKVTIATCLGIAILTRLQHLMALQMSRISMPILYGIDPNDQRYKHYIGNNEA